VAMPSVTSTSIDMVNPSGSSLLALSAEQIARDDHAMHFGRAFADAFDAHLAMPALERHLARDAEPAEHLDATVDHLAGDLGGVDLADRRIDLDVPAHVAFPGGLVDEQARGAQLDLAVRDHPLDRLLVGEARTESLALLPPFDREINRGAPDADHCRRIGNARMDQPGLGELEALALLPEPVLFRHFAILEIDLVGEVRADHRDRLVAEALELLLHDERG